MKSNITFAIGGGGDPPKEPVSKSDVPYGGEGHLFGTRSYSQYSTGTYIQPRYFFDTTATSPRKEPSAPAPKLVFPTKCFECGEPLVNKAWEEFKKERAWLKDKYRMGDIKVKYKMKRWTCPNYKKIIFGIGNGHTDILAEPIRIGPKYHPTTGEEQW